MNGADHLTRYYLTTALQGMEEAHAHNRDATVGVHISRAIGALQELMHQAGSSPGIDTSGTSDPYEMNSFNSAV